MKNSQFWVVKKVHWAEQYNDSDEYLIFEGNGKQISTYRHTNRLMLDELAEAHNRQYLEKDDENEN